MIRPLSNRIVIDPIFYPMSDAVWTPTQRSRYKNGQASISGKVIAVGPRVTGAAVGDIVYHSDSCFKEFDGVRMIREDDIMFITDEPVDAKWLGADEVYE